MPNPGTLHLVDPHLVPMLDIISSAAVDATTLPALRAQRDAIRDAWQPGGGDGVEISRRTVSTPDTSLPLFVIRPEKATAPRAALLHFHAGGFVLGTPEQFLPSLAVLARALDAVVVSVDYRLAPENPFPAALSDAIAALDWLHASHVELGIDPGRVGVIGESAGGGLATMLALHARDNDGPAIAFLNLMYPMLDDRIGSEALNPVTAEFVWTRASNAFGWDSLLAEAPDHVLRAYAVPARVERLDHLPPIYIAVGALDLFLDEDVAFALRLMRAGVPVELTTFPGAFHGFDMFPVEGPSARARQSRVDSLRRAIAGASK